MVKAANKKATARKLTSAIGKRRTLQPAVLPAITVDNGRQSLVAKKTKKGGPKSTAENIDITVTHSTRRGPRGNYEITEENKEMVIELTDYCSFCRDGGEIIVCSGCEKATVCTLCIIEDRRSNKDDYLCPGCYMGENYQDYMLVSKPINPAIRTFSNESVAFVSLYLDQGLSNDGSVATILEDAVAANFAAPLGVVPPLRAFSSGFDCRPESDEVDATAPVEMLTKLSYFSEDIQGMHDIVVYIQTHSDITEGGLHYASGDRSQTSILLFLQAILGDRMMQRIHMAKRTVLVLGTCGYLYSTPQGKKDMQDLIDAGFFMDIIGFSAHGFMPISSASWLVAFLQTYLFGNDAQRHNVATSIAATLGGQDLLGSFTDILHFSKGKENLIPKCHRFIWAPLSSRPWGETVDPCGTCGKRLYPVNAKHFPDPNPMQFRCKGDDCKREKPTFKYKPHRATLVRAVGPSSSWMCEEVDFFQKEGSA